MSIATVIIPTHNHSPLLEYSVHSALAQTIEDLDIVIIGDGVPDATREVAHELVRRDDRVRFLDEPKGQRHGEAYRAEVLAAAGSQIVCYLADDDLWFPDHVELMEEMLRNADFVHSLGVAVLPQGGYHVWGVDLAEPYWRDYVLTIENRIPLGCAAHTLESYRRLPQGWSPAPDGIYTDLFMWRKFLALEGLRCATNAEVTLVHFASSLRGDWTLEERVEELRGWATRLASPDERDAFRSAIRAQVHSDAARWEAHANELERGVAYVKELERRVAHVEELEGRRVAHVEELESRLGACEQSLRDAGDQLADAHVRLGNMDAIAVERNDHILDLTARLQQIEGTRTWRIRNRLLATPGVGGAIRAAARGRRRAPQASD